MFPIGDDEACLSYLVARRWPEGVKCPRCGNTDLYDASSYKPFHWQCRTCARRGYRFSVLAGTIFENTKKPLRDWFRVAHFMLSSKKGMSALQIQRMMGFGSYETRTVHVPQNPRRPDSADIKLGGIIEMDETYIGGKDKNRHWNKKSRKSGPASDKTPIVGAIERQGNVVARVLKGVNGTSVAKFVNEIDFR